MFHFTLISGYDNSGKYKSFTPNGFWKEKSAVNYAVTHGIVRGLKITHIDSDVSGLGRTTRNVIRKDDKTMLL